MRDVAQRPLRLLHVHLAPPHRLDICSGVMKSPSMASGRRKASASFRAGAGAPFFERFLRFPPPEAPLSLPASLASSMPTSLAERQRDDQVEAGRHDVGRDGSRGCHDGLRVHDHLHDAHGGQACEVSLYRRMNSLVMVGITRRTVCGMITNSMVCAPFMPSDRAASNCPLLMDWMPARNISHRYALEFMASTMTPSGNDGICTPAKRQPEERDVYLQEQRRAAHDVHVERGDGAQNAETRHAHERQHEGRREWPAGTRTATMPIAMRKPLNTTGKLRHHASGGFKNRLQELVGVPLPAPIPGLPASEESCSVTVMPLTAPTAGMAPRCRASVPSASGVRPRKHACRRRIGGEEHPVHLEAEIAARARAGSAEGGPCSVWPSIGEIHRLWGCAS